MFNSAAMSEFWENRRNKIIIFLSNLDAKHYLTVHVEVVGHALTPSVCCHQSAFTVTIVLGVTPAGREVLVFHRPFLVQKTLAVFFTEPVKWRVHLNVFDAYRYSRWLVEIAVNLVPARNVREIFGRVYHNLSVISRTIQHTNSIRPATLRCDYQ